MSDERQYPITAPARQDGCAAGIGFGIFTTGARRVRRAVKRPLVQAVQNVQVVPNDQDWQKRYNSVYSVLLCLKVFAACAKFSVAIPTAWTMPRTPLLTTKITKDTKVSEMFS